MAFVGGSIQLPGQFYRPLVGVILLIAAARLLWPGELRSTREAPSEMPIVWGIVSGVGIGFLSGLTGTGGGIFLSPLLLFMRWAETKQTAGIAVAFILANSIAGLIGLLSKEPTLPEGIYLWAAAATLGGLIGSEFGSKRLGNRTLRRLL